MTKLRVLHLADIHLGIERYGRLDPATGLNTRLLDFLGCLDEAIEYALGNEIDLALFCGDAYRNRDPNPTYQREFAKRINRLARHGVKVFLLVGNHDQPASFGRANTVEIFETLEVENVVIGRKPGIYRIETRRRPVQIVAIPWLARNSILSRDEYKNKAIDEVNELIGDYLARRVAEWARELDPAMPAVLAAHLSVAGASYGSERSAMLGQDVVVSRSAIANPAFDYVALGHIHKYQVVSNYPPAVYAGSIERVDFGEEDEQKGFVVAEVERGAAEFEFRPVKARRFETIEVVADGENPTDQVLRAIRRRSLTEAVVRVMIKTTPDKEPLINDAEIARSLKDVHYLASISKQVQRTIRKTVPSKFVQELSPLQALELYLRAREYPPEKRRVLLEHANRLMSDC